MLAFETLIVRTTSYAEYALDLFLTMARAGNIVQAEEFAERIRASLDQRHVVEGELRDQTPQ